MNTATKFIVWDWNGTLQDDLPVSIQITNISLKRLGRPPIDENVYREHFKVPICEFYRNIGLSADEISRCLSEMQKTYFEAYERLIVNVGFRPGAREILDFATQVGIMSLILSNHLIEAINKDLQRLNKRESFQEILAWPNREAQFQKPKGNLLADCMNRRGLRPENGLIVGDTPEEIKVAREHGLVSIAISGGYNSVAILDKAKPDYIISSLHDLKPILQQRGFAA